VTILLFRFGEHGSFDVIVFADPTRELVSSDGYVGRMFVFIHLYSVDSCVHFRDRIALSVFGNRSTYASERTDKQLNGIHDRALDHEGDDRYTGDDKSSLEYPEEEASESDEHGDTTGDDSGENVEVGVVNSVFLYFSGCVGD
jgi:hypothetical protein